MRGQPKGFRVSVSFTRITRIKKEIYKMKLNVYKKREVVKTYEADTYDLMFGVLEDVADAVHLDELKSGSDAEIIKIVGNLVLHSMGTVRDLLKDIFPGITDEELKNTRVSEIAQVIIDVVKFTIAELMKGFGSKN